MFTCLNANLYAIYIQFSRFLRNRRFAPKGFDPYIMIFLIIFSLSLRTKFSSFVCMSPFFCFLFDMDASLYLLFINITILFRLRSSCRISIVNTSDNPSQESAEILLLLLLSPAVSRGLFAFLFQSRSSVHLVWHCFCQTEIGH